MIMDQDCDESLSSVSVDTGSRFRSRLIFVEAHSRTFSQFFEREYRFMKEDGGKYEFCANAVGN